MANVFKDERILPIPRMFDLALSFLSKSKEELTILSKTEPLIFRYEELLYPDMEEPVEEFAFVFPDFILYCSALRGKNCTFLKIMPAHQQEIILYKEYLDSTYPSADPEGYKVEKEARENGSIWYLKSWLVNKNTTLSLALETVNERERKITLHTLYAIYFDDLLIEVYENYFKEMIRKKGHYTKILN